MTIHIVTEEIMLQSEVIVNAAPGERTSTILDLALEQVNPVCEKIGLIDPVTTFKVSMPKATGYRQWSVKFTICNKVTRMVKV
jgi:hypothetical protein